MEYKNTCQEQCKSNDEYCMNKCGHPLLKCQCKCYAHRKWECRNKRCSCWKEQGSARGIVAEAMRKAENKALAQGLGKAASRVAAKKAEQKQLHTPSKAEAAAAKKAAEEAQATRAWMHAVTF